MKNKKQNKKEYKTLLSALAFGATDEAQKILSENGIAEADSYEELEYNLAKLYSSATDKIKIEKQFAEIHPHSKFILKYLSPKVESEAREVRKEDLQTMETETTPPTIVEMSSNASGNCACGCSSAEGTVAIQQNKIDYNALALVSLVAIVGLVIIAKK
jgi:Sec7-like guanine-nucleotide exchange factor